MDNKKLTYEGDNNFDKDSKPKLGKSIVFGVSTIGIFCMTFLLWALTVPLESAAMADGKITVDTNRKSIQHLEGGIVKKINVKEGDLVTAGDVLVTLDETQPLARMQLVEAQLIHLLALETRLIAERDQLEKLEFPEAVTKNQHLKKVKKVLNGQNAIFESRKSNMKNRKDILNQRIVQTKKEIESLQSQVVASQDQLDLINEEIKAVKYLVDRKMLPKPRLLALQREAARLSGNRDQRVSLISMGNQKIGETKLEIMSIDEEHQKEVLKELRETQRNLNEAREQYKSAKDILDRTVIVAPRTGKIVDLDFHTIGGVIKPGMRILDIVPTSDELLIEVRVEPNDIDIVREGLAAKVKLTAYKRRTTPILSGEVVHVSADAMNDQHTGKDYFLAKVKISADEFQEVKNLELYPGMPANVMIITNVRTPMQYFLSPIKDSFYNAFREE